MHILEPKHIKLKPEEVDKLLNEFNISRVQLPKIKINDLSLPEGCEVSDIVKIERVMDGEKKIYYRVVVV